MNWSWPGEKISKVLSKRERALISLLLIFVLVYTYYTWLLLPLLSEIAVRERENQELLAQVSDLQNLLQDKRVDKTDELEDQVLKLFQQVPAASAIPEAISSLQKMAGESGVALHRIHFEKLSEEENDLFKAGELQDEQIQIRVVGEYHRLRAFIAEIEKTGKRIMVLNHSRIGSGEADFWSKAEGSKTEQSTNLYSLPQLQADLSIKLFHDGISLPED